MRRREQPIPRRVRLALWKGEDGKCAARLNLVSVCLEKSRLASEEKCGLPLALFSFCLWFRSFFPNRIMPRNFVSRSARCPFDSLRLMHFGFPLSRSYLIPRLLLVSRHSRSLSEYTLMRALGCYGFCRNCVVCRLKRCSLGKNLQVTGCCLRKVNLDRWCCGSDIFSGWSRV